MPPDSSAIAPFSAPYAPDDVAMAARLLGAAKLSAAQEERIDLTARRLIAAIRVNDDPLGGVEDMLREFALSTKEGLALMVLAEALLRVPDARTADQFIEDRLAQGDFIHHETKSSAFLVNAPNADRMRIPLAVTLSADGRTFDQSWRLRGQADLQSLRFEGKYKRPGYHYPKSVVWNGWLYVGFAVNKEDVQVTRVPLASLSRR